MAKGGKNKRGNGWAKLSVSGLEADIAYFDARLALLEENPSTSYQQAQKLTYTLLETTLGYNLVRLRNMPVKNAGNSRNSENNGEQDDD
jgi:hypothetical protein